MIAENLAKIRKSTLLAQNDFALKLGISPRAYVNYERGERKPPYEVLVKLYEIFDVNLNWLIIGKGNMFNEKQPYASNEELEQKVVEVMKKYGVIERWVWQFHRKVLVLFLCRMFLKVRLKPLWVNFLSTLRTPFYT